MLSIISAVALFFFQVLLRMKENEIEYLHKEISCLRNELQFLNTVRCLKSVCVLVCKRG